ncbi:hypothetical protein ANANG_G00305790 [Anguilla anguilla]|uniref:Phorbol-ester/DAG-type domain-containing protein n=1 Tax=Anguilla anguilla TaxID=7936 RepID=A0A9D3LNH3_ANGAN|nr:hypothetical protein ANANG_G00305790 [Anguilla anguilla]
MQLTRLWGIIKQGYKCKDCGVNCHKQCRELLVLACRKLPRAASLGSVSASGLTHSSLPNSPTLPTCADEDEVFEFPSVAPGPQDGGGSHADGPAVVRARLGAAAGAGAAGRGDAGSHTFPKTRYRLHHRKGSKSKGLARWVNEGQGSPRGRRDSQEQTEGPPPGPVRNGVAPQRDRRESPEDS